MSRRLPSLSCTVRRLLYDVVTLVRLTLTSRVQLAAENLFLRKQLALYQERHTKPRRPDAATRVALVLLSRPLDWRSMLDLPGFFGPLITGEWRQLLVVPTLVSGRVPLGQREPAEPASARQ
jgi:hypothetical protein